MAAKDTDDAKPEEQDTDMALDMSQTAVKKMIADARERGYITYDQLNQVLPPDQVSSEQIEDVMSMLSEMGINVIEDDEAEEGAETSTELVEASSSREVAVSTTTTETLSVRDCSLTLRRTGKGQPLLWLHGTDGLFEWPGIVDKLGERYDVIVPEHPGFGDTPIPGWMDEVSDLAYLYLDLLKALKYERVHVAAVGVIESDR